MCVKSLSHVPLCVTPWTVAHQAPQSMEFSRKEYWSGLLCPPPGELPNPETELTSHVSHIGKRAKGMQLLLLRRFSRVWLCATPWTAAHQAPPSLGFSRQEHWSGLPFPSPMHESEKLKWSCSVMSNSSRPHGLQPTRLLHPWDFPGKSTGVGLKNKISVTSLAAQWLRIHLPM